MINFLQRLFAHKVKQNGQIKYYNRQGILIYFIGNETDCLKKAIYDNKGRPLYMENSRESAYWKYKMLTTTIIKVNKSGKRTLYRYNLYDQLEYKMDACGHEFWYSYEGGELSHTLYRYNPPNIGHQ